MKKFLMVSMMALAVVLASSCNKEENSGENYVNTWVAKDIALTQIVKDLGVEGNIDALISQLPDEQKTALQNMKVNVVMKLDKNGKGNFGLHLDKNTHTIVNNIYSWISGQGVEIPTAVAELVARIKDNDYIGLGFTYVAEPTDDTKGKFTFTVKIKDDAEESSVDYSGLSDSAMTLSYEDKDDSGEPVTITYDLKSLSTSGITINNFIDISVLASLNTDDEEETPATGE